MSEHVDGECGAPLRREWWCDTVVADTKHADGTVLDPHAVSCTCGDGMHHEVTTSTTTTTTTKSRRALVLAVTNHLISAGSDLGAPRLYHFDGNSEAFLNTPLSSTVF